MSDKGYMTLAEQIQSLSAENERLKQQNKDAFADYKKQWDRAEAAESQLSAMREALRQYGQHIFKCPGPTTMTGAPDCRCGFAQALEGDKAPDVETLCQFCDAGRWKPRSREQHSDTCPIKLEGDKAPNPPLSADMLRRGYRSEGDKVL